MLAFVIWPPSTRKKEQHDVPSFWCAIPALQLDPDFKLGSQNILSGMPGHCGWLSHCKFGAMQAGLNMHSPAGLQWDLVCG